MSPLRRGDYLKMEELFVESLSKKERKVLQKLWPFKIERNELIRDFSRRGVPGCLLQRVCGLSWVQVFRILKRGRETRNEKNPRGK